MEKPVIVQSDRTILLEVNNPLYPEARDTLSVFAELVKSPEHIHTYRITAISLWNAAALGHTGPEIVETLRRLSRYEVPENIEREIEEFCARYGALVLEDGPAGLELVGSDPMLVEELANHPKVAPFLGDRLDGGRYAVAAGFRGHLKQALIKLGWPVEDRAGYEKGDPLDISLRPTLEDGTPFVLRDYQIEARDNYLAGGGGGVVVLPCGAGKTIVGMGVMAALKCNTLILTTSITAVRQWIRELIEKTTLSREDVGEYTGVLKEIRPVTITTYQMVSHRPQKKGIFPHFRIFDSRNWGLIVYDEVHLLPAPVFRITAEIQSRRRLGLTATLVREDGRERDVFSLIGPKRYDVPWKELERQGWIAKALCVEIRLDLTPEKRVEYAVAGPRSRYRIAAENPAKLDVLERLVERHSGDNVLIIGQYLRQLEEVRKRLRAPLITGRTPARERDRLYDDFRRGRNRVLVVSKVGNFAIDLPDANVLIQLSGTFGSRQEEAQRLGRILRPKADGSMARFYSLITRNSDEMEFAAKRQLFLTEQGYKYAIRNERDCHETL